MGLHRITNQQGEDGSIYKRDTSAWVVAADGKAIKTIECIQACAFTVLTDLTCTPTACQQITLAAGARTFGHFTAITLATGEIKGYY